MSTTSPILNRVSAVRTTSLQAAGEPVIPPRGEPFRTKTASAIQLASSFAGACR